TFNFRSFKHTLPACFPCQKMPSARLRPCCGGPATCSAESSNTVSIVARPMAFTRSSIAIRDSVISSTIGKICWPFWARNSASFCSLTLPRLSRVWYFRFTAVFPSQRFPTTFYANLGRATAQLLTKPPAPAVANTIGYNMEIKYQLPRPNISGMPTGPSTTIIRHNVFIKNDQPSPDGDRPNVLLGGFPNSGAGSTDMYEVYGNFFFHN